MCKSVQYVLSYSGFKSRPSFSITLYLAYFVNLYRFRAYLGPSSGGTTVCIQQLVLIILLDDCPLSWLEHYNNECGTRNPTYRILPFTLKADSHIACRANAMSMPRPYHALIMTFFSRPRQSTAVERRPVGYLPAFGFFRLPCGVPRRLLSEA